MSPVTAHLHGDNFAVALTSGIHRVIGEQELLNRINVFPVADGDTGTNLCLSLGAALGTLNGPDKKHLGTLLVKVADALLDGARGNSGAIVAQFFQGMSDSASELSRFTTGTFSNAVTMGSEYAHDALSEPREGTILSVIAAFAHSLRQQTEVEPETKFDRLIDKALRSAQTALTRTQDQLDVLRKAGVVDAGAKGFVCLIEGMADFIIHGRVSEEPDQALTATIAAVTETAGTTEDLTFRYCTECIVNGQNIDRRKLREAISELGNSLVLAGTKRKAKIHIHVNDPDELFQVARQFGDLSGEKADDMHRQQHSTHGMQGRFAVITDSAADISDAEMEEHDIHMVPLRVQFGDRGYLDKVSITAGEFYAELESNPVHPTTSQPAPGDFRRQFQFLASHYPDVISINLTGGASGTFQAATSAAERTNASGKVHVIDSMNASVGQGLLTVYAAECAARGLGIEETISAVEKLRESTKTFALVGNIRYAVRGGRVPKSRKVVADLLRLTPVLKTKPDGNISTSGVIFGRGRLVPKFARYVARRVESQRKIRLAIGHARCAEDAQMLESELKKLLPNVTNTYITGLGSAIGVHGGPGTMVVAVQYDMTPEELASSGDDEC